MKNRILVYLINKFYRETAVNCQCKTYTLFDVTDADMERKRIIVDIREHLKETESKNSVTKAEARAYVRYSKLIAKLMAC